MNIKKKRNIVLLGIIGLTALMLTAPWRIVAGYNEGYDGILKTKSDMPESGWAGWPVEGVWIVVVPTPAGNITMLHTLDSQDPMGAQFTTVIQQVNKNPTFFGMFPEADSASEWVGQTIKKGRNSYETTMLIYGTKEGQGPLAEIVHIEVCNANWEIIERNRIEGEATVAVYLADQDGDFDGLPDEDQEPIICAYYTYSAKRLQPIPPCEPTPMP